MLFKWTVFQYTDEKRRRRKWNEPEKVGCEWKRKSIDKQTSKQKMNLEQHEMRRYRQKLPPEKIETP